MSRRLFAVRIRDFWERTIFFVKCNIYLMYGMTFLQGMVFYGAIATLYRQAQGVTIFQITLIESISYALTIALEVPWGVVADRIGYKRTMVLCCWLYFLSKIIFWQASDFGGFLAERVLLSVVIAGLSGVDTSILYLCAGQENSQHVFGVYNSLGMAGLLAASAVYTLFVGENYRLAGLLTVFSYGAAALLSLGLTEVHPAPEKAETREPFAATLRATLAAPGLLVFLIAVGLLTEVHQTVTVFLNQLQYERCGISSTAIGAVYIAATLLGLCGVWSAAVTRRTGERRAAALFCLAPALACTLLVFTDRALLSVGGDLAAAGVGQPVPALPGAAAEPSGANRQPGYGLEHPCHDSGLCGHRYQSGLRRAGPMGSAAGFRVWGGGLPGSPGAAGLLAAAHPSCIRHEAGSKSSLLFLDSVSLL